MKKLLAFILTTAAITGVIGQTAASAEKNRKTAHESLLLYRFDMAGIAITNEFSRDSAIILIPSYIRYPYSDRKITVYGPTLGIGFIPPGKPGDFVNNTNVISYPGAIQDTSVCIRKLFTLSELEVKITRNGKVVKGWQNVQHFPLLNQTYIINSDSIAPNEEVIVELRNVKKGIDIIKFHFQRQMLPLMPYLSMWSHDSSSTSFASFVEKRFETKKRDTESINSFYRYWPQKYAGVLKDQHYFTSTKLALYFRKPYPAYPDSSMEYCLIKNNKPDTLWHTTGHVLFITNLSAGTHYTLLVRYKAAQYNIQKHTFYTDPAWYQTSRFKYQIAILIILKLAFVAFLINWLRTRKINQKKKRLALEIKSIRSQLNPHFVFNALSSIQSLINKKEIDKANTYLSNFSSLMRDSLKSSDTDFVPLSVELRMLETYIKLEQLRFNFSYSLDIDQSINQDAVEVPSLLLQPLIENAVRHGISGSNDRGNLTIEIFSAGQNLDIKIIDNGAGFEPANKYEGYGLKLTKDRINLLNQTVKKQPIKMYIESNKDSGTTVHLVFENWLDT